MGAAAAAASSAMVPKAAAVDCRDQANSSDTGRRNTANDWYIDAAQNPPAAQAATTRQPP